MVVNNKTKTAIIWEFARKQHISYPLWSTLFFGIKLELNHLAEKLEPHERLMALSPCKWHHRRSLVAITSQRVLVINCGLFGTFSNEQDNSAYYPQISGAGTWGRLMFHSYKFPTPGTNNTIIINSLWEGDYQRINRAYIHARSQSEQEEQADPDDVVTRVTKRLNQIRKSYDAGELSDEAYEKLRTKLENELLNDEEI